LQRACSAALSGVGQGYDAGMRLTEWEQQRLTIFSAAELARRHRAAGLKLNAPEAIALMCDAMLEAARAGASYEATEEAGRAAVAPTEVMDGVAALVDEVRLEVLLGDGTRLIVLRHPLGGGRPAESADQPLPPGRRAAKTRTVTVTNTGRHVVRVSSHYPFDQVNKRLAFDRDAARGYRLDLPAGSTLRWAPGETREVTLVRYAGLSAESDQ
jgi:urease subunit gamma/beta